MSLTGLESTGESAEATHASLTEKERLERGITQGLIRFSTGIEEAKDLIADMERAIRSTKGACMKLDILAFGAHPDDVELGYAATMAKEIALGKKVGIVDLTQGELGTRGSAELRMEEAAKAADILDVLYEKI